MRILHCELKKILQTPVLWGLLAVFLVFNFYQISTYSYYQHDINLINDIAGGTGVKIDDAFLKKFQSLYQTKTGVLQTLYQSKTGKTSSDMASILKEISENEYSYNLTDTEKTILKDTACLYNLNVSIQNRGQFYQGFDIRDIGNGDIKSVRISGTTAEIVGANYEKLQNRVKEITATKEQETLFFPGLIYEMHGFLFKNLFSTMILEAGLLGVLIMMYSVNYEFTHKTEALAYTSRRGRMLICNKLGAAMLAGFAATIVILSVTLVALFFTYHYSNLWNATITSALNTQKHGMSVYPYITWKPMTVWQYLWASVGIAFVLQALFSLLAFALASVCRNNYTDFLVFLLAGMVLIVLPGMVTLNSILPFLLSANPVQMWWNSGRWLMESGPFTSYPHYELITSAAWGFLAAGLGITGIHTFRNKNIS